MVSRRGFAAFGAASVALHAHDEEANPVLDRVALIHGATAPFAIAGYRMGEAALRTLKLARGSFDVEVVHHSPRKLEWSCIVDGLQAATGASVGKLNLSLVESAEGQVFSVVRNRKTTQEVRLELTPAFIAKHRSMPAAKQTEAGSRLTATPEVQIFKLEVSAPPGTARR